MDLSPFPKRAGLCVHTQGPAGWPPPPQPTAGFESRRSPSIPPQRAGPENLKQLKFRWGMNTAFRIKPCCLWSSPLPQGRGFSRSLLCLPSSSRHLATSTHGWQLSKPTPPLPCQAGFGETWVRHHWTQHFPPETSQWVPEVFLEEEAGALGSQCDRGPAPSLSGPVPPPGSIGTGRGRRGQGLRREAGGFQRPSRSP